MSETVWLRFLEDHDYHGEHKADDVISIEDQEYVDYLTTEGIAEIVDVEAEHHTIEDEEFKKFGVEKDTYVYGMADVPIYLGSIYPQWKLRGSTIGGYENGHANQHKRHR